MTKLEKYINFILFKAVRLSDNDNLAVWCSKEQSDFAEAVSAYACKNNINNVEIYYADGLADFEIPREKVMYWKQNSYKLLWVYSDSCTAMPPISWTTVNVATESWAKQIFPEIAETDTAVAKLWDAIFAACRIDDNDPVLNWDNHIANLNEKADKLSSYQFKALHFKNSLGTDLHIDLVSGHKWINCTTKNRQGETVITNIPTEEVFTVPDSGSINGTVYSTKPLLYKGQKIENFYLKFKNGAIESCGAQTNLPLLKELLSCCKNADRIGEVALVPHSSPLSQLGIFWYDTSFDENAGCHLALGYAYPQALNGYHEKTDEELDALGFNHSDIHEDFVIGTDDMEVAGILPDGNTVIIMKNGEWAI